MQVPCCNLWQVSNSWAVEDHCLKTHYHILQVRPKHGHPWESNLLPIFIQLLLSVPPSLCWHKSRACSLPFCRVAFWSKGYEKYTVCLSLYLYRKQKHFTDICRSQASAVSFQNLSHCSILSSFLHGVVLSALELSSALICVLPSIRKSNLGKSRRSCLAHLSTGDTIT